MSAMRTKPVQWSDGMLMLPHHFQAAEAHLLEMMAASHSWQFPYGYGLHNFELNREALVNFDVRIPRLQARLKDGTLVSVPENAHLESLDVRPVMEESPEVYLHLVVPELVVGEPNTATTGGNGKPRFIVSTGNWEEVNEGGNPRAIETHRLNAQILATPTRQSPKGYEAIPVARLKRSLQSDSPPELDLDYIPPLLNCECWPSLREGILASVCSQLGSYIKTQADYLRIHGGWTEGNQPQIRRAITQLDAVNMSYPLLVQLAQTRGVHPRMAYFELCRLIGQLSILRESWQPPELPLYDHDDLGRIFRAAKEEIDSALTAEGLSSKVQRYPFVGMGEWMEVGLDPRWLQGKFGFYIGVRSELPPERVEQLFSRRWLDWKLGSSRTIVQIYANAEAGLQLKRVVGVHQTLPVLQNVAYFKINPKGMYWDQIVETRTLALKVNERYIRSQTVGQSDLTVYDPKKTPRDLSLELFVVEND
jgi:type VI secretion system protein ImpJ